MMGVTYKYKPNRGRSVSAQVVGELLEQIEAKAGGVLHTGDVVNAAKPSESPIHGEFQWDDLKAADAYRRGQARDLISSVTVVSVGATPVKGVVQAFVNINDASGPHYTSVTTAMSHTGTRKRILDQALEDLNRWRARYGYLKELADLFELMDKRAA
jgi:hypothetical protein